MVLIRYLLNGCSLTSNFMSLTFSSFPEAYLEKLETGSYVRTISDSSFKPHVGCTYVFADLPVGLDEKAFLRYYQLNVK